MKKFKIGDLVQLSAAGKRVDQNSNYNKDGAWGMIIKHQKHASWPIICHWFGGSQHLNQIQGHHTATFKEYELKRKRK